MKAISTPRPARPSEVRALDRVVRPAGRAHNPVQRANPGAPSPRVPDPTGPRSPGRASRGRPGPARTAASRAPDQVARAAGGTHGPVGRANRATARPRRGDATGPGSATLDTREGS